ncbi:hypothetical protein DB30_02112 [Enhygromyxa salina]|uniref:Uncharacterized protein n=1 Tax=Enhygromyxa salina TaxID=215803 RepID=A0A0C2CVX4_9BACT|nr:hypothetical protein [Enhygromyxa salina]KIG12027.1 hypothetical protein DB30_02112 [Enhygromyxa salina]
MNHPQGVRCNGAAANTSCQALCNGQTVLNVACHRRTWNVGNRGAGIEINAQGNGVCACSNPGYTARPCTNTCNGPTQTIEVTCG